MIPTCIEPDLIKEKQDVLVAEELFNLLRRLAIISILALAKLDVKYSARIRVEIASYQEFFLWHAIELFRVQIDLGSACFKNRQKFTFLLLILLKA